MLKFNVAMKKWRNFFMAEEKDTKNCEEEQPETVTEVIEEMEDEVEQEGHEVNQPVSETDITTLNEENEALQNKLLRLQAEYDNFKKRTAKEKSAAHKYKAEDFAIEMLPIVDNFERAMQTETSAEDKGFYEGIKMVYNQLLQVLESQEIVPVETVGEEFDPNMHHAVMQTEEEEQPSNTVVEELQKGYMLKDKVIRPAMVKVNK